MFEEQGQQRQAQSAGAEDGSRCSRCGAAIYPGLARCTGCLHPTPRIIRPARRAPFRGLPSARLGAVLTVGLLGALAIVAVTHLVHARVQTLTPGQAVTAFYGALLRGDLRESFAWVHPRHREQARRIVGRLLRRGIHPTILTRAVLQMYGDGRLRVGVGKQVRLSGRRWRVEVVATRGRVVARRWAPVRGTPQRWYLDENPFAAAPRRTRRLGRPALATLR